MAGNLIIFCVYFGIKATYLCISIIPSAENQFMFNLWSLLINEKNTENHFLSRILLIFALNTMSLEIEDHKTASESMHTKCVCQE